MPINCQVSSGSNYDAHKKDINIILIVQVNVPDKLGRTTAAYRVYALMSI